MRALLRAGALAATAVLSFPIAIAACADDEPAPSGGGGDGGGGAGGGGPTEAPVGPFLTGSCDPLVPTQCGFPFPSNVWLVKNRTTASGYSVRFGAETLPARANGQRLDPSTWSDADGWSAGQAPMTHLPGATVTGLPTQHDLDRSLAADAPTILLEADTGVRVPHFAELDRSAAVTGEDDRTFLIRPVVRPKDGTRYIVAIRDVVDATGAKLPPSPAFAALRDGTPFGDPSIDARRALYDDIFAKLEAAGIPRGDLQLAWDYTTASRENNTGWLLHMRDDALAAVGEDGPEYRILSIEEDPNPNIKRRILGAMTVPLYLDQPGPGGRLVFGDDGLPRRNGTAEYEFLVHVPHAATTGTPRPPLQNGHGLLGDKVEGRNGYLAELANRHGYVAFSVDFVGFAEDDEPTVLDAVSGDIGKFRAAVDRQHQGMVNSLLAMRLMRGRFARDENVQFGGQGAIDTSVGYYRGDSQGGIYGVTYMALTTDVTRGLLGEPGMPYNLLLNRSRDFEPFFILLRSVYTSGRDMQLVLALVQMLWDRTEPSGYAPYVNGEQLPGTPRHEVLLHVAIGDQQVTPLGAHLIARSVGARTLSPSPRPIWGVEEVSGPFEGSGIVEFDFGLDPVPDTNVPPTAPPDDDPHDAVRVLTAAYAQTDTFLRTGRIEPTCDGPCDPE